MGSRNLIKDRHNFSPYRVNDHLPRDVLSLLFIICRRISANDSAKAVAGSNGDDIFHCQTSSTRVYPALKSLAPLISLPALFFSLSLIMLCRDNRGSPGLMTCREKTPAIVKASSSRGILLPPYLASINPQCIAHRRRSDILAREAADIVPVVPGNDTRAREAVGPELAAADALFNGDALFRVRVSCKRRA